MCIPRKRRTTETMCPSCKDAHLIAASCHTRSYCSRCHWRWLDHIQYDHCEAGPRTAGPQRTQWNSYLAIWGGDISSAVLAVFRSFFFFFMYSGSRQTVETEPGPCGYAWPTDHLFSGVKTLPFFPAYGINTLSFFLAYGVQTLLFSLAYGLNFHPSLSLRS